VKNAAPMVSVIVPAYDAARYLPRLLASVAAQTLADFEAIVVNDGSSDDTANVVRTFAERDSRFRLIDQANAGVAAARNRALQEASGAYIAPVDADDLWHRDYLAEMVAALSAPGAERASFAFCFSHFLDEDDRYVPVPAPGGAPPTDFLTILRQNPVGNGSCSVFRHEAILAVGGYDATLKARGARGGEDWKLVLELTAEAPAVVVPKFLVGYRRTNDSLSADPMVQARSSLLVLDDMRRKFPDIPARHFWAARTDFLVWVLPHWARRRDYRALLKYGALAYLANPLWPASRQARHFLYSRLRSRLGRLGRRRAATPGPMLEFGEESA
jgi:glycosyltransferase involved in cell wall biosynthesis